MPNLLFLSVLAVFPLSASAELPKVPILLDTDIGDDIDDAFALALALKHPRLDLRGVTTVAGPVDSTRVKGPVDKELLKSHKHGDAFSRAMLACRFLHEVGRDDVPVASGASVWKPPVHWFGQLGYGAQVGIPKRPVPQTAVDFLYRQLKARPGELTLVAIGPLTNAAGLLQEHPDCKRWIKRIALMGGSLRVGYTGKPPVNAEWNIKMDAAAAQVVFQSGVPLVVAPLDATASLKLEEPLRRRSFDAATKVGGPLRALYELWGQPTPTLYDPVAVALCLEEKAFSMEDLRVEVDGKGFTRIVPGVPNARVATSVKKDEFLQWFVDQLR